MKTNGKQKKYDGVIEENKWKTEKKIRFNRRKQMENRKNMTG